MIAGASADVVVVGPAPPIRGGIAQHTARLVDAFGRRGVAAGAVSYRRLYPGLLFPGRNQRTRGTVPAWSCEALDVLRPDTWIRLRRELAGSHARVVIQWWHPVVAPALRAVIGGLDPGRLVAICHNVLPHESVPGSAAAARMVLGRCGRIVYHSRSEQEAGRILLGGRGLGLGLGGRGPGDVHVPLPCILPEAVLTAEAVATSGLAELAGAAGLPPGTRIVAAAGHVRSYKGMGVLIDAWRAARRPPDARLVVVGESYLSRKEASEVRSAASHDTTIIFINRYIDDKELVSFLKRAEVLVSAHLSASQSGLVAVARALGLPCILSDAGGLAEQAGPDDDIVARGDTRALVRALEQRLARAPSVSGPMITEEAFLGGWQRVVEAIGITNRP